MMYDDMRMVGDNYSHSQQSIYRSQMSLWDSGHWKMEPLSPPSPPSPPTPPPVPSSPFVDLDTDSWFQDGGLTSLSNSSLAAANVHNHQNSLHHSNHHYNNNHHHQYATCESPDLIVPDTSAPAPAVYRFGDVITTDGQQYQIGDVTDDAKPPTRAEAAQKLLNDLDEWIKEEPFSDWYEEKIDLPIFEELETVQPQQATPVAVAAAPATAPALPLITRRSDVPAALLCHNTKMAAAAATSTPGVHHPYAKMVAAAPAAVQQYAKMAATPIPVALIGQPQQQQQQPPPPSLMQEFDFVLSHHQHHHHHQEQMLTPPESPTDKVCGGSEEGMTMLQNMPTEELDELVRIRVESLVEGGEDDSVSQCSYSLGEEDCSSSSSGSEGGRGANSPAPSLLMEDSSSGGSDDPEWSPSRELANDAGPAPTQSKRRRQSGAGGNKTPYSRRPPPEEKRQRKKEQNKNAATRYRLKKKAEIEEILGEERGLMDKNQQLKTDVGELEREIKYLKSLMREMLRRKKVIK